MNRVQAEYSLYEIAEGADEEAMVMPRDLLPTVFECIYQTRGSGKM
jgi:hypothetical protein